MEKPAALREACDLAQSSRFALHQESALSTVRKSSICDCRLGRQRKATTFYPRLGFGGLSFSGYQARLSEHSPGCMWYKSQNHKQIAVSFGLAMSKTLGFLVEASLAYKVGAGGFSISPNLHFKLRVETCPARELAEEFFGQYDSAPLSNIDDFDKGVSLLERQIMMLFQDGRSSPHYRYSGGSTLLHVGPASLSPPHPSMDLG